MDEYKLIVIVSISMLINFYIFIMFVKKSLADMNNKLARTQEEVPVGRFSAAAQIKKSILSDRDKALIHAELERRVKERNNEIH